MIRLVGMETADDTPGHGVTEADGRTYDDGFRDGVRVMAVIFLMVLALAIGGGIDSGSIQMPF